MRCPFCTSTEEPFLAWTPEGSARTYACRDCREWFAVNDGWMPKAEDVRLPSDSYEVDSRYGKVSITTPEPEWMGVDLAKTPDISALRPGPSDPFEEALKLARGE